MYQVKQMKRYGSLSDVPFSGALQTSVVPSVSLDSSQSGKCLIGPSWYVHPVLKKQHHSMSWSSFT